MLVLLKFDIYFEVDAVSLKLYELVPQKKCWQIRLETGVAADVKQLMIRLTEGIDDQELQKLLSRMPSVCRRIVSFIRDKRLFFTLNPADRDKDPFFRQLEVFDSWNRTDSHPREIQRRLSESTVLVIGAGGVGSTLANLLASCGVGSLCCVDFDLVELHNLARQSLYTHEDIGAYKVEVLARRLRQRDLCNIMPIAQRLSLDNVDEVVEQNGTIHIATGFPLPFLSETTRVIERILEHEIPFLCIGEHDVGPLLCQSSDIKNYRKKLHERFMLQRLWEEGRVLRTRLGQHPSYAPDISIVCGIAADEIVRCLTEYAPVRTRSGVFSLSPIKHEVTLYSITEPDS